MQAEIAKLQSDKATGLEKMQSDEQEIVSRDNEIKSLNDKLSEALKQNETITAGKNELEHQLTDLKGKQNQTVSQLEDLQKLNEQMTADKEQLELQLSEARKENERMAADKDGLQQQLDEVQQQKATLETDKSELERQLTAEKKYRASVLRNWKNCKSKTNAWLPIRNN